MEHIDRQNLGWLQAPPELALPEMTLGEAEARVCVDYDVHYGAPLLRESGMLLCQVLVWIRMFGVRDVAETYAGRLSKADLSTAITYAWGHPELFTTHRSDEATGNIAELTETRERISTFAEELAELSRRHGLVVGTGYDGAVLETMPEGWRGYCVVNRGRLRHLP